MSSIDPNDNPHTQPLLPYMGRDMEALDTLKTARRTTFEWTKRWGDTRNWSSVLYGLDRDLTPDELLDKVNEYTGKIEDGRQILHFIRQTFLVLPSDHWTVRDAWLQALDVAIEVQAGISAVDAHVTRLQLDREVLACS
jgi:hypothetical protein